MSFTAKLALIAKSYTLVKQEDDRAHLRDVERNDKDAFKPVARHFNLPSHSEQHMAVCGLSLHLASSESRKTLQQNYFPIPTASTSAIHSTDLYLFSHHHIPYNSVAPLSAHKPTHNPKFLRSL